MNRETRSALKRITYALAYGASPQTASEIISLTVLKCRKPSTVTFRYDANTKTILRGE